MNHSRLLRAFLSIINTLEKHCSDGYRKNPAPMNSGPKIPTECVSVQVISLINTGFKKKKKHCFSLQSTNPKNPKYRAAVLSKAPWLDGVGHTLEMCGSPMPSGG